jgi:hypothetical protein
MNSSLAPTANEYAALVASALIAPPLCGYTASALAPLLITIIRIPATVGGSITPVLAAAVVTTLIGLVNAVAVPCVEPAAVILAVTPYATV